MVVYVLHECPVSRTVNKREIKMSKIWESAAIP